MGHPILAAAGFQPAPGRAGGAFAGKVAGGARNFRFKVGLKMPSNVAALSPAVRASGEETFDMVVPAMKVRGFNFTGVTRF